MISQDLILRLSDNIRFHSRQANNLTFLIGAELKTFEAHDKELADFIYFLTMQGNTKQEITSEISKFKNVTTKQRALEFLGHLLKNNFINYELNIDNLNKVILCPYNSSIEIKNFTISPEKKFKLSRFSYMRKEENGFALINPLSEFYLVIHGHLLMQWLFTILDVTTDMNKWLKDNHHYSKHINGFMTLLSSGNFICDEDYKDPDSLKTWEFHDLLFHYNSRLGKSTDKYYFGATYRFKKTSFKPLPFDHKSKFANTIKLYKPDLKDSSQTLTLFQALEKRCSIRKHGKQLISIREIGEFLFRSVSVRLKIEGEPYDLAKKPFPSAGAIHELEFYIVCNMSADLSRGIYHYNSEEHSLCEISKNEGHIKQLIKIAQSAWGQEDAPLQVLVVITSKFQKMSWKYEGIAYRNTLINVGAAMQTMYLVATAMNLAPCALGYGNSNFFSSVAGLNPLEESSVGEFALGCISDCPFEGS